MAYLSPVVLRAITDLIAEFSDSIKEGQAHSPVEHFLEVALEEHVPVLMITGGNPEALLRRIQAGQPTPRTMVLVAGTRAACKAEDLDADAMITVGFDGGEHLGRDDVGTMVLVPRMVEAVKIPVLASGGIADERGLAAALALGAEGIEMSTRFVAVQENVAHQRYKEALVQAQETDTVIIKRTLGRPERVLKGPPVERILGRFSIWKGAVHCLRNVWPRCSPILWAR